MLFELFTSWKKKNGLYKNNTRAHKFHERFNGESNFRERRRNYGEDCSELGLESSSCCWRCNCESTGKGIELKLFGDWNEGNYLRNDFRGEIGIFEIFQFWKYDSNRWTKSHWTNGFWTKSTTFVKKRSENGKFTTDITHIQNVTSVMSTSHTDQFSQYRAIPSTDEFKEAHKDMDKKVEMRFFNCRINLFWSCWPQWRREDWGGEEVAGQQNPTKKKKKKKETTQSKPSLDKLLKSQQMHSDEFIEDGCQAKRASPKMKQNKK